MAKEAQKEPTMEEILASIRKIISEDEPRRAPRPVESEPRPAPAALGLKAPGNDDFAEPQAATTDPLMDDDADDGDTMFDAPGAGPEPAAAERWDMPEPEAPPRVVTPAVAENVPAEPAAPEAPAAEAPLSFDEIARRTPPEPVAQPAAPAAPVAAQPLPSPEEGTETMTQATARAHAHSLSDEATADAAASALSKLVARMDFGSDTTLEGLVREILKPMLKEWLDQNLPAIVEEKVEAEVQRISRLVR